MQKVLVVDDKYATIVAELCRGIFEVATAETLKEALQQLEGGVDAVITDIHFPRDEGETEGPYGVTLAEECKRRGIPFQMVLGHHGEEFTKEYLAKLFSEMKQKGLTGDFYEFTDQWGSIEENVRANREGTFARMVRAPEGTAVTLAHIAKGYVYQWEPVLARTGASLGIDTKEVVKMAVENIDHSGVIAEYLDKQCEGDAYLVEESRHMARWQLAHMEENGEKEFYGEPQRLERLEKELDKIDRR